MENMKKKIGQIREIIYQVLERNRFAVLATQLKGQPHASLIAFTPLEGIRFIAFATYRNTLKYQSILYDPRVAILIEDLGEEKGYSDHRLVITAVGEALKPPVDDLKVFISKHLERHPHLEGFLNSPDCEFVVVAVHNYQLVADITEVSWYSIQELSAQAT